MMAPAMRIAADRIGYDRRPCRRTSQSDAEKENVSGKMVQVTDVLSMPQDVKPDPRAAMGTEHASGIVRLRDAGMSPDRLPGGEYGFD